MIQNDLKALDPQLCNVMVVSTICVCLLHQNQGGLNPTYPYIHSMDLDNSCICKTCDCAYLRLSVSLAMFVNLFLTTILPKLYSHSNSRKSFWQYLISFHLFWVISGELESSWHVVEYFIVHCHICVTNDQIWLLLGYDFFPCKISEARGGYSLYEGYYICSAISTPLLWVSGKFV